MSASDEYLFKAAQAERLSKMVGSDQDRAELRKIAEEWRALAEQLRRARETG